MGKHGEKVTILGNTFGNDVDYFLLSIKRKSTIFEIAGKQCQVNPITTDQYPTKATRPAYSVLDKSKIKETLGIEIPYWKDSLMVCMKEINNEKQ